MNENPREPSVLVEPGTVGIYVRGGQSLGDPVTVVIPWEKAVDVSRRILQLARNRGDVS